MTKQTLVVTEDQVYAAATVRDELPRRAAEAIIAVQRVDQLVLFGHRLGIAIRELAELSDRSRSAVHRLIVRSRS